MLNRNLLGSCVVVLLSLGTGLPLLVADPGGAVVTVKPGDHGEALANPGMGWVLHFYDNSLERYGGRLRPADTVDEFPGQTVVYLRLAWKYLEPEEGRFNWSMLDTPAQRWIEKGKKIALRITCSETDPKLGSAVPDYVRTAGAKGYYFEPGKGVVSTSDLWEPDYDDSVFLEKLAAFLRVLAERYDGDPNVAFIDVGSFGVWGEGHTFWSTKRNYSVKTIQAHVDLYRRFFKKTLLVANDDFMDHGRGEEAVRYALQNGLTLRDDSIMVQAPPLSYAHASLADPLWRNLPVVLESEHYGSSKERGCWGDGSAYLAAVEDYHASYVSIHWYPREFLDANRPLIDRINRRLGYRLQPVEISWPAEVCATDQLVISHSWKNTGVAPCLVGGQPIFTLEDMEGGLAAVLVAEGFNVRDLPVGPPEAAQAVARTDRFSLPGLLKPGIYRVHVSIGNQSGTPTIALPLDGDDGRLRYRLGDVKITAP